MDITKMLKTVGDPKPYDKGTDIMWTDEYISKHLLDAHLNGVASRPSAEIEKTVDMIHNMIQPGSEILDLGCGPGLYTERLAKKGHKVTGVDFSRNSIDYAIKQRETGRSNTEYINADYLDLDFEGRFDLIMMVYCDFEALVPEDRTTLVKMIHKALKPGGVFLFDVIDEETIERLNFGSSWEMSKSGFWKATPYICLNKDIHFKEYKVTLEQHVVIGDDDSFRLYRFWHHYFNQEDVEKIFGPIGFSRVESIKNVLSEIGPYNDHGVVFYAVSK